MPFVVLLWICAGCIFGAERLHAAGEKALNLFIWSEYLDPAVVSEFERKHQCKVVIDLYEDAESMLSKIQNGGVSQYDVVVPPDHLVPTMIKLKLLAPLRKERLPNLRNLEPRFAQAPFDPTNGFSVAYQWGTVGVLARKTGSKPVEETWGILFEPSKQPGPFVLIDSMRDQIGCALKYRGYSLNSTDPRQLKEARDLILTAKKRALAFEGSVGGKNRVLGKSARAAVVYSGEAGRAISEDPDLFYFVPREGSQIWVDTLAILARAPHRELAEDFLNFMLDARVGAQISSYTQFSSPNRAAREHIKPEQLRNPILYPDESVMKRLEFLHDLGAKARIYDEVWTQVKAR